MAAAMTDPAAPFPAPISAAAAVSLVVAALAVGTTACIALLADTPSVAPTTNALLQPPLASPTCALVVPPPLPVYFVATMAATFLSVVPATATVATASAPPLSSTAGE